MNYLPISLNLFKKKVLIVGGGNVALLKSKNLSRFTSDITFLATDFMPEIANSGYPTICKAYEKSDLKGFSLVYACTDNRQLNHQIKDDCSDTGLLVSVCDNPPLSDFVSPATYQKGTITISVGSDGTDVKRSVLIRNRIRQLVEEGILDLDSL